MLTRRQVVQCSAVSVGAIAVSGRLLRQTASAPVLVRGTTLESTLVPGPTAPYRVLGEGPAQPVALRTELAPAHGSRALRRAGLASLVQLTDLHVTDVQSPLRFEYLDRRCRTGHRPQELLGTQGAAALVGRVNSLSGGPFTGRPIDAVVSTGDNTDNQAGLELEWLLTIFAGGLVHPSSGDPEVFEGVAGCGLEEYWQPDRRASDRYKDLGFPEVPGLLEAATRPFVSPGLGVPWLLTMGNHDAAALGTLEHLPKVAAWHTGDRKVFSADSEAALLLAARLSSRTPGDHPDLGVGGVAALIDSIGGHARTVTPDPRRAPFTTQEYVAALREPRFTGAGPVGHGYAPDADGSRLYFTHWLAPDVLAISLDSTNQAGGSDGSVGRAQLRWLDEQLTAFPHTYVVVFSHHPSDMMTNLAPDPRDPQELRHPGADVLTILHRHPQVLAWVNGHRHRNRITPRPHDDPRRCFWEINTASHIDSPQQARVIEVAANADGTISLFTTMVDADSPGRASRSDLSLAGLASLYRELAYNDPSALDRRGAREDGNTELMLADPLA